MLSDGAISTLQLAHVLFSATLFVAFAYQGSLGWRIRRKRVAGVLQDFSVVKRHRALGPLLATLLPAAFLAGLVTAFLHKGSWAPFPGHLAGGTLVLALALSAVLASRRIRGPQTPWRARHFALGLLLLGAYLVQIYLGLDIFL